MTARMSTVHCHHAVAEVKTLKSHGLELVGSNPGVGPVLLVEIFSCVPETIDRIANSLVPESKGGVNIPLRDVLNTDSWLGEYSL